MISFILLLLLSRYFLCAYIYICMCVCVIIFHPFILHVLSMMDIIHIWFWPFPSLLTCVQVTQLQSLLRRLQSNLPVLDRLHGRILSAVTDEQTEEHRRELDYITDECNQLTQEIRFELKGIHSSSVICYIITTITSACFITTILHIVLSVCFCTIDILLYRFGGCEQNHGSQVGWLSCLHDTGISLSNLFIERLSNDRIYPRLYVYINVLYCWYFY